jgi:hypothetical protein
MENAGIRISASVIREDGSIAQEIVFDQRGLTGVQLHQLQDQAITPCVAAVMRVLDGWGPAAQAKVEAVAAAKK